MIRHFVFLIVRYGNLAPEEILFLQLFLFHHYFPGPLKQASMFLLHTIQTSVFFLLPVYLSNPYTWYCLFSLQLYNAFHKKYVSYFERGSSAHVNGMFFSFQIRLFHYWYIKNKVTFVVLTLCPATFYYHLLLPEVLFGWFFLIICHFLDNNHIICEKI